MRQVLLAEWGGKRVLTIGRCAVLTTPHNGRAASHYCGPCWRGCITHSYFSSIGSTLPAAERTGRLTLRPNSVVESVLYDEKRDRATGVRVIDADTRQAREFRAQVIFLCASALESTRILLNSRTRRFATGLGNSSGVLGRNLMDHVFGAGARGTLSGQEHLTTFGNRPNCVYVARFRNVGERHPAFVRGYGFQADGWRSGWDRGSETKGFSSWPFWKTCSRPARRCWRQRERPRSKPSTGACMTSSANQNPSITYMALTARACDYAVSRMRNHEL